MREFKYRAWDSWWGKMYYFDFTKNIEATPDDELKGLWILHEEGSVYAIQDKIKIMQYTGLHDIEKTKIYEDDLVKIMDYPEWEGSWRVMWDDEHFMFVIEAHGDKEPLYEFDKYLIVGNIYENYELLEV